MRSPFSSAKWIWAPQTHRNQYVLFARELSLHETTEAVQVRIAASYHYELFINGRFVRRGPVHCDPKWMQYDEYAFVLEDTDRALGELRISLLVHHPGEDVYLHFLSPGPPGLRAEFSWGDTVVGTDGSWKCLDLPMWDAAAPKKGNPLGPAEDYDASKEPDGWAAMIFTESIAFAWPKAVEVPQADMLWTGYGKRMVPYLERSLVEPRRFKAWRADGPGAESLFDVSKIQDEEPLLEVSDWQDWSLEAMNQLLPEANAFTLDLGAEHIGFYTFDIEAPVGAVVEVSGSELLREERPWIFRKGVSYSMRYRAGSGRRQFTSFSWNGFRYIHVVIRNPVQSVKIHRMGCLQRRLPLHYKGRFQNKDPELQRIYDLCRRTLEVGVQEHLIDCPTREQTQYWGDALFIAQSLWKGFGEGSYLDWYLECFLQVPVRENGQISAVYPGDSKQTLLDYTLIPPIGQRYYLNNFGQYYKPREFLEKGLLLKQWYDRHLNSDGLVEFDYEEYNKAFLRNFIDHPGMGWHNFPHRGIDRHGVSCPLNVFLQGYLTILSELAEDLMRPEAKDLREQAQRLGEMVLKTFFDGEVFHDALRDGILSEGTSWQTNCLPVFFNLITGWQARSVMEAMLDRYDDLCRCSPYFHFFFLPAMRKAGMEREAAELIKREYRPMLERDATTTWEGFLGDEKDSLCHPWSTAPFLFLLEKSGGT